MQITDKQRQFTFLAHWVETWNWLLWWSADLHKNPNHIWRWVWLFPIYALVSIFYFVGRRAYDVVDRYEFNNCLKGETVVLRNFGYHFLKESWRERIRRRILEAVLDAQKRGAKVIGLGALTKAEWLTAGGAWIVEALGDKLKIPIVHGDTLTAAAVMHRVVRVMKYKTLPPEVFVTGGTSKIGRALTLALAQRQISVYVYTQSAKRFAEIICEAETLGCSKYVLHATNLQVGAHCRMWVTGKAEKGVGKKIIATLPHKAVVVNFSVPDPLSVRLLRRRPDVEHLDGGLMGFDPAISSMFFMMRLKPGMLYSCHAGTMVHAYRGWTHHEVGPVSLTELDVCWEAAMELGLFLPPYTSHLLPVDVRAD